MPLNGIAFLTAEVIVNLSHNQPDNLSGGALQTGDGPITDTITVTVHLINFEYFSVHYAGYKCGI
jgi:hypothetical protein